jgi:[acyl-carrier-protein] S-malonyltransferase
LALAILCSGQGWQRADMFALTGSAPAAAGLFAHAANLLGGRDPREIVLDYGSESLHHNRVAQILCSLQSLAATAALRESMTDRLVVAGYSVGEVASWGVAGALAMTDTLEMVGHRADAMDAATPPGDGMLFVRGLSRVTLDRLCERHDAAIAIVEPNNAFVVGGNRTALRALAVDARALAARHVVEIPVEIASHTRRLARASIDFCDQLRRVTVRLPPPGSVRLLSGIDGSAVLDAARGLDKLARQISQTVQWASCLQSCIEAGATCFLELGPGVALSGMVANAYRDVPARSLDEFKTLDGVRAWLSRFAGKGSG